MGSWSEARPLAGSGETSGAGLAVMLALVSWEFFCVAPSFAGVVVDDPANDPSRCVTDLRLACATGGARRARRSSRPRERQFAARL